MIIMVIITGIIIIIIISVCIPGVRTSPIYKVVMNGIPNRSISWMCKFVEVFIAGGHMLARKAVFGRCLGV